MVMVGKFQFFLSQGLNRRGKDILVNSLFLLSFSSSETVVLRYQLLSHGLHCSQY